MINKQGIILGAMDLYRANPELRKGQCICVAVSQWHPDLGITPPEWNCFNDDNLILDYLEWADAAHDLRVLGPTHD